MSTTAGCYFEGRPERAWREHEEGLGKEIKRGSFQPELLNGRIGKFPPYLRIVFPMSYELPGFVAILLSLSF